MNDLDIKFIGGLPKDLNPVVYELLILARKKFNEKEGKISFELSNSVIDKILEAGIELISIELSKLNLIKFIQYYDGTLGIKLLDTPEEFRTDYRVLYFKNPDSIQLAEGIKRLNKLGFYSIQSFRDLLISTGDEKVIKGYLAFFANN